MSTISRHYNKFIKLFDVSLRDGLQSWKKIPSTDEKKQILHKIASLENVKNHAKKFFKKFESGSTPFPLRQYPNSIRREKKTYHTLP